MKRRSILVGLAAVSLARSGWATTNFLRGSAKPIQIVVPFGAGGSADITARMLADFLQKKLNQTVTVENRPGASGIIAVEAVRKAPADGSVLLLASTSTNSANPNLFKKLPYDPERDFRLVGSFGNSSSFMLVRPDSPYKTLAEFITAAKSAPNKLTYGHFNASSQIHGALIGNLAGFSLLPVPYKLVATAITELIGGSIDTIFIDTAAGESFVASSQLRALSVHGENLPAKFAGIPLLRETVPGYDFVGFVGIAAPSGTPLPVLQELNDLVNDAATTDPIKARLEGIGFTPKRMSLAELATFDRAQREKWKRYVAIAKLDLQ